MNANTSFERPICAADPDRQSRGHRSSLPILEDFAQNVTFEPAEVDKERGVIIEEWRLGFGAAARIHDAQIPVLLKGPAMLNGLPSASRRTSGTRITLG